MTKDKEWNAAETAALDAAFAAGLQQALTRGTSLYMQLTTAPVPRLPDRPLWIAMYPPRHIAADDVAAWCERAGFRTTDEDLFFPHAHVVRAARDLGITQ